MKTSPDTLVQQFLDGMLDPADEAEALRRIAEDPEARALLRFERQLAHSLAADSDLSEAVPPNFSDRVMQAVAEVETNELRLPVWDHLRTAWAKLTKPRLLTWRPIYAIPALIALIAVVLWMEEPAAQDPPATPVTTVQQVDERSVLVRFMYVDEEAQSVAVAGDFNYWDPVPLTRQETGGRVVWTGLVAVPPGEHEYMFVLDGEEWVTDPLAPQARDDGFGNTNAVLSL